MVWLYIPNIISYIRVVILIAAIFYSNEIYKFFLLYSISFALDAVDGPVARVLNQTTNFGAVLDMVTDRISTAILFSLLKGPIWLSCMSLDISSHWIHWSASLYYRNNHKQNKNSLLKWYYYRPNLFTVCLLSELYVCLTLLQRHGIYLIQYKEVFLPVFLIKQIISGVQLYEGCKSIVEVDRKALEHYV